MKINVLNTSIHKALLDKTKRKLNREEKAAQSILDDAKDIIAIEEKKEKEILSMFGSASILQSAVNKVKLTGDLKKDDLVHLDHIRDICLKYNLRFTDLKDYKGDVPYNVICQMKNDKEEFDKTHCYGQWNSRFKIIAPVESIHTEKIVRNLDPVILQYVDNDYWKILYHWGNDMTPIRRIVSHIRAHNLFYIAFVINFLAIFACSMGWLNTPMFPWKHVMTWIPLVIADILLIIRAKDNKYSHYNENWNDNTKSSFWIDKWT
jgi:hypothetical protein